MASLVLAVLAILGCAHAALAACTCNGASSDPIPIADLPNAALKVARLSHGVLPGVPATPHAFAILMAALFDAHRYATGQPRLTNATMLNASAECSAGHIVTAVGVAVIRNYVRADEAKMSTIQSFVDMMGNVETCGDGSAFVHAITEKFKLLPMSMTPNVPPNPPSTKPGIAQCSLITDPDGWQPLCMPQPANPSAPCKTQVSGQGMLARAPLMSSDGKEYTPVLADGIRVPNNEIPLRRLFRTGGPFAKEYRNLLNITSKLNDYRKTVAERFAPRAFVSVLGLVIDDLALHGAGLDESARVLFTVMGSVRDAVVTVATYKHEIAIIRPISVLQCGLIGRRAAVWNGPYRGMSRNVTLSYKKRWVPYLNGPASASFPSGHTAVATAGTTGYMMAVGWRKPKVSNCMVQVAGSSKAEGKISAGQPGYVAGLTDIPNKGAFTKGYVPGKDVTICWNSWRMYAKLTAASRLFGGIHTPGENAAAEVVGRNSARRFIQYVKRLQ